MVLLAWLVLGNLAKLGLRRPAAGPLELKDKYGRTPVLDYGALARIRAGDIAVVPAVTRFGKGGQVELADGRTLNFDAVILATGYRSNVPQWLQVNSHFNNSNSNAYMAVPFFILLFHCKNIDLTNLHLQ
jgi:indole-3-pyruvate monooxygenase